MRKVHKGLAFLLTVMMLFVLSTMAMADDTAAQVFKVPTRYEGKTVILHTNDVHGEIEGYAYIPELRAQLQALGAEVITVDAGDFSQGTPYVSFFKGKSAIEMMNAAGYDVVTLGNHEFDYGAEQLMENLENAKFKTICADILVDATGKFLLDSTTTVETATGMKIGFFGMETPETASKTSPAALKGLTISSFNDLYVAAQKAVDSLKDADLVIGITHLGVAEEAVENGYRSVDLYKKVKGIDFILDGHSHTVMTSGEGGEPIQSTGSRFETIGVVVIDNEIKSIENHFLVSTEGLKKDPKVEAAAKAFINEVDTRYNDVVARSEVRLIGERKVIRTEETNLGNLITDAMVWSVLREGGIEQDTKLQVVGICNAGGIRANIEVGNVTMKDLKTVLPFSNTICVVYVTGDKLLEVLEASTYCSPGSLGGFPQTGGIDWTLDTTKPYDQGEIYLVDGKETSYYAPASIRRVTINSVNREPFDPKAVYTVVTSNICAEGGDTYNAFHAAFESGSGFDTGVQIEDAVADYIKDVLGGVITAEDYGEPRGMAKQIR